MCWLGTSSPVAHYQFYSAKIGENIRLFGALWTGRALCILTGCLLKFLTVFNLTLRSFSAPLLWVTVLYAS